MAPGIRLLIFLSAVVLVFTACIPQKEIVYFQQRPAIDTLVVPPDTTFKALIHSNDILTIYVASLSTEASKYFNFTEKPDDQNSMANGYLVDANGDIQLPLVGNVRVVGLTSSQARDTIEHRLQKYLITPSVKLNIRNFRVTVIGEVTHPGIVSVQNERITLPEAIALAGDLTVYASRINVMIVRETNGKREYGFVDLTSRELFTSPYYHLHSDDVIYVEPTHYKRFLAQNYYRVLPVIFGGISLIVSLMWLSKVIQ
jgi:polysaccharide biosynthesis/export protein